MSQDPFQLQPGAAGSTSHLSWRGPMATDVAMAESVEPANVDPPLHSHIITTLFPSYQALTLFPLLYSIAYTAVTMMLTILAFPVHSPYPYGRNLRLLLADHCFTSAINRAEILAIAINQPFVFPQLSPMARESIVQLIYEQGDVLQRRIVRAVLRFLARDFERRTGFFYPESEAESNLHRAIRGTQRIITLLDGAAKDTIPDALLDNFLLDVQERVYKSTCFGVHDANDGKSIAERIKFLEDEIAGFLPGFEHPVLEMPSDSIFVDTLAAMKIISEKFKEYLTDWDKTSDRVISLYDVGLIYDIESEFFLPPPSLVVIAIGMRARRSMNVKKKWIAIAEQGIKDFEDQNHVKPNKQDIMFRR